MREIPSALEPSRTPRGPTSCPAAPAGGRTRQLHVRRGQCSHPGRCTCMCIPCMFFTPPSPAGGDVRAPMVSITTPDAADGPHGTPAASSEGIHGCRLCGGSASGGASPRPRSPKPRRNFPALSNTMIGGAPCARPPTLSRAQEVQWEEISRHRAVPRCE